MSKKKRRKPNSKVVAVRSWVAVDAKMRNSAGAMGGTPRQKNRRDRRGTKQDLRRGDY